jgi:hypothetical protein
MAFAFNPITGKLDLVGSGGGGGATLGANTFTDGQTITAPANTSALTASYSVTGTNTTPLLDLSGTWNTTGIARGILLNITDTASNAASLVADFQRNGTSVASITKTGAYNINAAGLPSSGIGWTSSAHLALTHNGTVRGIVNSLGITANADTNLGFNFAASNNSGTAFHARILCDGTGVVALRNGTNAQTFRLYNTFTDASNYERGFMRWNSNVLEIGTEAGGTGAARDFRLVGALSAIIDCGSSGTTQLRSAGTTKINIGNSVVVSTLFRITSVGSLRLEGSATPSSATATGTTGDIQWDANYIYVCTATNTWKRAALSTW